MVVGLNWKFTGKQDSRPRLGELTESGIVKGKNLTLAVRLGRVDWVLQPPEKTEMTMEFPSLGSYLNGLDTFVSLMKRWLPASPALQRLAFGPVLMRQARDRVDGYQMLSTYLPFLKLDEKCSDFMYRINRLRESATNVAGLKINRLSTWSVVALAGVSFSIGVEPVKPQVLSGTIACRLEMDMNTSPDFAGDLPEKTTLNSGQLARFATEIAATKVTFDV